MDFSSVEEKFNVVVTCVSDVEVFVEPDVCAFECGVPVDLDGAVDSFKCDGWFVRKVFGCKFVLNHL